MFRWSTLALLATRAAAERDLVLQTYMQPLRRHPFPEDKRLISGVSADPRSIPAALSLMATEVHSGQGGKRASKPKYRPHPAGSSAYVRVLCVWFCGGIWCATVVGVTRSSQEDKHSDHEFDAFRDGMHALGQVHSQCSPVSLCFGDEALERLFVRSRAQLLCTRVKRLCLGLLAYVLLVSSLSDEHDGSIMFNPRLFDLGTACGLIYSSVAVVLAGLCLAMFALTSWPAFQKCQHLEVLTLSWTGLVLLIGWLCFYRWNVATNVGDDPEGVFVSSGTDGDYIASLQIMAIYLCIQTPLRFKMLAPVVLLMPLLYVVTLLLSSSPEGTLVHELYVLRGEDPATGFLAKELEMGAQFFVTVYLALWGKYVMENQNRLSFMTIWESFKMVQELSDGNDCCQATGVGKVNEALKHAMGNLEALSKMTPESPAFNESIVLAKHQVGLAKRILQRADKLFEVDANDALKGTNHADNSELKEFISANMGGQSFVPNDIASAERPCERSVADEGRAGACSKVQGSVRVEDATELAAGWGDDWGFSGLELAQATRGSACLFAGELALVQSGRCDVLAGLSTRRAWVRAIHSRYLPNSYHNEAHAAQVSHFCLWFAKQTGWLDKADRVQSCALLLAALAHDVGHIGRTNLFCTKAHHSFAMMWNESSPLENMHAATCFAVMRGDADLMKPLDGSTRGRLRKAVIRFVLATDIKEHHSSLAKLNGRMEDGTFLIESPEDGKEAKEKFEEDVLMAGEAIIKASDIAHGMLPWGQHRNWSYRVNLEFFEQGDEEKSLGMPISPLCDRGTCNIAGGQGFFIGCLCGPLLVALKRFARPGTPGMAALERCMEHGEENKELWKEEAESFDPQKLSMEVILQRFGGVAAEGVIYPYAFDERDVPRESVGTAENLACIARYQHCAR